MEEVRIRNAGPSDYHPVISVLNDWWNGRNMRDMLPKLFFVHFQRTSFVAEYKGAVVGFLIGFLSQTFPDEAYIHFAGVHPDFRRKGLGRELYGHLFEAARRSGCRVLRSVTSPVNRTSIAFHLRMGFRTEEGDVVIDGIPVTRDYDGSGADRVLFMKFLDL
jgi:ribosomal protein S18 acetylase RimI-like enzyme